MKNYKYIAFIIITTFSLLILFEMFSHYFLSKTNNETTLLFKPSKEDYKGVDDLNYFGFDEIHPLIGWKMSPEVLQKKGFHVENDLIVLNTSKGKCPNQKTIFITGGSTTDIGLREENWPSVLINLLEKNNHCVRLIIGAVGGYSSGQEFLQIVLHRSFFKPDLHISYSGANEHFFTFLVSPYEYNFYEKAIQTNDSKIFPNLTRFLKLTFTKQYHHVKLSNIIKKEPAESWFENMQNMHVLSKGYNYKFVGILQPVFNFSGQKFEDEIIEHNHKYFLSGYNTFYPENIQKTNQHSYLVDFTNTFENAVNNPFIDDCHITEKYQPVIAERIYKLIINELCL